MSLLVGVIGHVDHGKTALVRALTGMETDRLAEEQRRGISIALGFAHLAVNDAKTGGTQIDLIDMPGHERFVRTMVAGATGVDAALLVVAANEGIKPQTEEHLDIAALLGLRRVVVAISKIDLVSPEEADATGRIAARQVAARGMQVCAIVPTSANQGVGITALKTALAAAMPAQPASAGDGFAWLPVDRVFSIAGHGTVVTGTLRRGPMAVSDILAIMPDDRPVRLRALQVHGTKVATAQPGQRVAANLRDIAPDQIARGAALSSEGVLAGSTWLTTTIQAVDTTPPLATGSLLMLLFGTEEVAVRLRLLDRDVLEPGQSGLAQLKCISAVALPARERFILRRASPAQTLAGGRVIDPTASRLRRHAPGVLNRLRALADASPADIVRQELESAGTAGVKLARLVQLAGLSRARVTELLRALPAPVGRHGVAISGAAFARVLAALPTALAPHELGLSADQLATALPWAGREVIEDAVAELTRAGTLVRAGGSVRVFAPDRDRARANQESDAAAQLASGLLKAGLTPPYPEVILPGPQTKKLVERLIREGVLVRTIDTGQKREITFHTDAIEAAKRTLTPALSAAGLAVNEAGALLGISRKYSIPLLDHLDAIGFTCRVGDRRLLATPK